MKSILVTVGTDHHLFDRLVDWMDEELAELGDQEVSCLVQHGASRPSRLGENVQFMEYDALQLAMEQADVVVTHGGPASIFEARRHGHVPVCVPRDPALDEIVDGHQLVFARKVAEKKFVLLSEDRAEFRRQLAVALSATREPAAQDEVPAVPEGLPRLARVVQEAVASSRSRARAR